MLNKHKPYVTYSGILMIENYLDLMIICTTCVKIKKINEKNQDSDILKDVCIKGFKIMKNISGLFLSYLKVLLVLF